MVRHWTGRLVAHQLADVFTPATLPAGMKCSYNAPTDTTATPPRRVLDLTCLFRAPAPYFHRFVDCVLRDYDWIEAVVAQDSPDTLVLVQPRIMGVIQSLYGTKRPWQQAEVSLGRRDQPEDTFCIVVPEGTPVYYSTRQKPEPIHEGQAERMRNRAYTVAQACLPPTGRAAAAADGAPATLPPPPRRILFIRRDGTRKLNNASALFRQLASHLPHYELAIFYGNETVAETVCAFASAAAVVGVHGAGLANTIYSRPGTVVVELSPVGNHQKGLGPGGRTMSWRRHTAACTGSRMPCAMIQRRSWTSRTARTLPMRPSAALKCKTC